MISRAEQGATAVVVAISMLVIMGFAALVIDLGAGFNERAQDQSAADTGVMAGALSFSISAGQVRDDLLDIVAANLDQTYTPTDWLALWDSCQDAGRPANYQPVPSLAGMTNSTIDCISIAATGYVRVRIPDQMQSTTFGKILGSGQLVTSAVAEAKLQSTLGSSGVLPFGLLGSATDGSQLCLSSAPPGVSQLPCTGDDSGNFGELNSPLFGKPELGTSADCPNNPGAGILSQNIAVGIDHIIGQDTYYSTFPVPGYPSNPGNNPPDPDPTYGDWGAWQIDRCTPVGGGLAVASDGVPVNTMLANTGFDGDAVQNGLVGVTDGSLFSDGLPSRLQRGTNDKRELVTKAAIPKVGAALVTWSLDNKGLWEYLLPSAASVEGGKCNPTNSAYQTGGRPATVLISECLSDYVANGDTFQIFSLDILESPRFSFVPQFWYSQWGSGSHFQPVHGYRPVYLGGLWFNCNAGTDCDGSTGVEFFPGEGSDIMCDGDLPSCSSSSKVNTLSLKQLSGWLLPDSAVPPEAFGGPGGTLWPFTVELYK